MKRGDYIQKWWKQAQYDISSANTDFERKDFYWSCIKSRKAAELAVKTLILKKTAILPKKIHPIKELLSYLEPVMDIPSEIQGLSSILDDLKVKTSTGQDVSCSLYIQTGYFDAKNIGVDAPYEIIDEVIASKVYSAAVKLLEWVKTYV